MPRDSEGHEHRRASDKHAPNSPKSKAKLVDVLVPRQYQSGAIRNAARTPARPVQHAQPIAVTHSEEVNMLLKALVAHAIKET